MEKIQSTKIKELYNQLVKGNNDALDNFWEEAKIKGLPLIENIQGDDKNVNITFVYKAKDKVDIENVVIYGAFPSYRYKEKLKTLGTSSNEAKLVADYFIRNKEHLIPWDPYRNK